MPTPDDPAPIAEKLRRWLEWAVQAGASDLHVVVGHPPVIPRACIDRDKRRRSIR